MESKCKSDCQNCSFLKKTNIIIEDENNRKHEEIIDICEFNGKIDEIFNNEFGGDWESLE